MTTQRNLHKIFSAAMILVILVTTFVIPSFGAEKDAKTIRIAYPIQEGLTEMDEYGRCSGYTFEYLEKLAQNTGWTYEYVTVPGSVDEQLSTLMDMLESGEVDLMGGMVYSEEDAQRFTYCRNKYGTSHTVLQVLKDRPYNGGLNATSDSEETYRIAIRSTTERMAQEVTDYCKRCNIHFTFVTCESLEHGIDLLKDGQADALASSEMFVRDELQTIVAFSPKPFYFVTGKENAVELMETLDTAIININRYHPTYQQELHSQYFCPYADHMDLSSWEQEYVASLPPLKVGVTAERPPFQHYNATHKLHGICIDIMDYISRQTGLVFEPVLIPDRKEQLEMLRDGKLDIVMGVPYDYAFAREYDVILSEPYLIHSTVLVTGKNNIDLNNIENLKVALVANSYASSPDLPPNRLDYKTPRDCLKAVADGEADCTYLNQLSAQYYLNTPQFSQLKIATFAMCESNMSMAMNRSADSPLINIINRSISTTTSEFQNSLVFKYFSEEQPITLWRYFRENPLSLVTLICIVAALLGLMAILHARRREKDAKLTKMRLEKHLNLCSLAGDIFVEYDYKKKHLTVSCPDVKYRNHARFFDVDLMKTPEYTENKEVIDTFIAMLEEETPEPVEVQLSFIDGRKHWVELTISKMCDEQGSPLYSLARLKLIDEKFTAQEMLRHQAQRDGLTQLYNIGHFTTLLKERTDNFSNCQMDALMILDIDYFKNVNDTHGHLIGNKVLQDVAQLLRKVCPESAIIGRMGGDEFVVHLTHVGSMEEVEAICAALCEQAQGITISDNLSLHLSIGVAMIDSSTEQKSAFEVADSALYDVKRNGRNNYRIMQA